MLRALLALLLLANGVFLVWTQGWLAPAWPPPLSAAHEPHRLANQLLPEQVQVLAPQAASQALQAARGAAEAARRPCLEAGPFDAAALAEAEALLGAAELPDGSWQRETMAAGASPVADGPWLLRVPAADVAAQARLLALSLPGGGFRPCVPAVPVAPAAAGADAAPAPAPAR